MQGLSLDFLNLLFLPLMAITAIDLKKNWAQVFDGTLTVSDRVLLQRVVLFLLMPVVVLCHELGHVLAIKSFGGTIKVFHYAFLWGYVIPEGSFTQAQIVWTYFSGNLVQILIGMAAAFFAVFASAPPVVALLIYLAIWAVGGTTIIYALLSFTGLYGDWIAIYSQGVPALEVPIFIFQAFSAGLVLWALYGQAPRLWFAGKTDLNFANAYRFVQDKLKTSTSATYLLMQAALFWQAGLSVDKYLHRVLFQDEPGKPQIKFGGAQALRGTALQFLDAVLESNWPAKIKSQAYLAKGLFLFLEGEKSVAKIMFTQASLENPGQADAHFYKALLLEAENARQEAAYELSECAGLSFADKELYAIYIQKQALREDHLHP